MTPEEIQERLRAAAARARGVSASLVILADAHEKGPVIVHAGVRGRWPPSGDVDAQGETFEAALEALDKKIDKTTANHTAWVVGDMVRALLEKGAPDLKLLVGFPPADVETYGAVAIAEARRRASAFLAPKVEAE
jgi:hypothetical protein